MTCSDCGQEVDDDAVTTLSRATTAGRRWTLVLCPECADRRDQEWARGAYRPFV